MQISEDELDAGEDTPERGGARDDEAADRSHGTAEIAAAARACWASVSGLIRRYRRSAWERFGFAVSLGLAVALLTALGAAAMSMPQPALVGGRFGGWATLLGIGVGFLLVAKRQLARAYELS